MNENRTTKNAPSHGVTHGETLAGTVSNWAMPVARDDQKSPEAHIAMKQRLLGRKPTAAVTSLTVQVKLWPTPTAHDPKDMGSPPAAKLRKSPGLPVLAEAHGLPQEMETGQTTSPRVDLNLRFVEALMGLPSGWLTPSIWVATDSFQQWLRQHSLSYTED
jgi:hypothetical protein